MVERIIIVLLASSATGSLAADVSLVAAMSALSCQIFLGFADFQSFGIGVLGLRDKLAIILGSLRAIVRCIGGAGSSQDCVSAWNKAPVGGVIGVQTGRLR
jgi:hypothetical protein